MTKFRERFINNIDNAYMHIVNNWKFQLLFADVYLVLFFIPDLKDSRRIGCARIHSRACADLKPANHVKRLSHLFHNTSLPLRERRVPPQFVFYVFHFNLDSTFGLLSVTREGFFSLKRTIRII